MTEHVDAPAVGRVEHDYACGLRYGLSGVVYPTDPFACDEFQKGLGHAEGVRHGVAMSMLSIGRWDGPDPYVDGAAWEDQPVNQPDWQPPDERPYFRRHQPS
jgi:hypothetical protein